MVHSTRVSLTHTSNRSARTTSSARRHAAEVTRLIWECTSTTTWLLFLLSQTPYTRAVSAVVTFDDHQFDSSFRPDQSQCINSLLLDRHRIPPSAFTSTSDLSDPSGMRDYTAENLRSVNAERAWCPSRRIGTELTEFVQVDMSELNAITKMVINGLQAEEGGSRFTPHFYIRYKREMNEKEWRTYRPRDPKQTSRLVGSASALVPKFVVLDPPLIARWFRIYPYRDSPGFVCVRLEAYGCRFVDDLVEYQIPEGSLAIPPYLAPVPSHPLSTSPLWRKTEVMSLNNQSSFYEARSGAAFSDLCYDGYRIEPGGLLDGGLGCLTDMAISSPTTRPTPWRSTELNPSMHETFALGQNHWFVGWHRSRWRATKGETKSDDVVDMLFRFVSVRDFKRLRLYASNNYPEKVRLPRRIEVRFSVRGSLFSTQPVVAKDFPMVNHSSEVRKIELNLEGRIGQFLQLKAYFADDWLLFNEVKFVSFEAPEPTPIEEPTVTRDSKKESWTSNIPRIKESTALPVDSLDLTSIHRLPTVIVLALLIAAFLVVIGCAFIWIYWKRKNLREAKHRRALSLALDIQVENNEGLMNGQVGNIFPVNSQVLNANGTLPKKCPTKELNELRHLMELNQNVPGRTISNRNNRLSGATVPTSDEMSEADPFNPSGLPSTAFGRRVESSRSGLLASLKQSLCGTRRLERKSMEPKSQCVAAGLGSVQPLTMNCSMHQLAGSYESNAGQAYPNKNTISHHHHKNANNNIQGSNTSTNNNVGIFHGILSNPAGAVSFTDQLLPSNVPATPVRPLELSTPAVSAVLLNCPISNPTMIHTSTATAPDSELRSKAWRLQTAGMINPGAFGSIGSVQQELGLYTTVSGESDGESNCA
ncbi:putative discoidin domain receptor, partial [Fasciolopsis buskii]